MGRLEIGSFVDRLQKHRSHCNIILSVKRYNDEYICTQLRTYIQPMALLNNSSTRYPIRYVSSINRNLDATGTDGPNTFSRRREKKKWFSDTKM